MTPTMPETKKVAISAQQVKELRERTGAGWMDCKAALSETGGEVEQAIAWLRKKGIAKAQRKAGRTTREGAVGSYVHAGNKIGVLVELNCESDAVARTDEEEMNYTPMDDDGGRSTNASRMSLRSVA